jgi:hypothetical protein
LMSNVRWFSAAVLAAMLAAGALWCAGCSSNKVPAKETVEETPTAPQLLSAVNMGDPKAEKQLLSGFYAIEANAWRWTGKDFSVALRPPVGAAAQGATLDFELSIPQAAIDKLHSVTLSATVNGTTLAPETYSHEGAASYKRELAPNLLGGDVVRVDFHLDKAMPPANGDMRQLGVVARSVALEAKSTGAK